MISRRLRNRRRSRVGGRPEEASLFSAIQKENIEQIEEILKTNPKAVFEEDKNGALPLHYAAQQNLDHEIFAKILKANPEAAKKKTQSDDIPLHWAARYDGHDRFVNLNKNMKMLYHAYPRGVFFENDDRKNPLALAITWGDPISVAFLYLGEFVLDVNGDSSESNVNKLLKETAQQLIELAESSSLPQPSADQDSNCASWADSGECEKNPDYMLSACAASCNSSATNGKKGGKRSRRRNFRKL